MVKRPGSLRREHFVVLLSHRFATNDAMSAFVQSVDQIVNIADLANFKPVLRRGVAQYRELYTPFQETIKAVRVVQLMRAVISSSRAKSSDPSETQGWLRRDRFDFGGLRSG